MSISSLELRIRSTLDGLSNGRPLDVAPERIEETIAQAVQEFEEALRKQLFRKKEPFRLRMSNIGRPACQLQLDAANVEEQLPKNQMPYNHIMRMMLGDLSEVLVNLVLRLSDGVNITGAKNKVTWELGPGTVVEGEDDIEIDDKVYDVKSTSPWAYDNKWAKGWESLAADDSFGYIGQLIGYSTGQGKEPGGWIVLNKSTGEVCVVEFGMPARDIQKAIDNYRATARLVRDKDAEFERCFEDIEEEFYGKRTGNRRLPAVCGFCQYIRHCWPDAQLKPQTLSKAKNPRMYWYSVYTEPTEPNE